MTQDSPLGKPTGYPGKYTPDVLHSIPRLAGRQELGLTGDTPFSGVDIWNAYELSWLDSCGKPVVAAGEFRLPCDSPCIVESKSLKLYLNSLSGERFACATDARRVIAADLERIVGSIVEVEIEPGSAVSERGLGELPGDCIDGAGVEVSSYSVDPELLGAVAQPHATVCETLHTHLFRSLCPVTGQPDWASLMIRYRGPPIDRAALLKYLIAYREHAAFHEHCVERIFMDLLNRRALSDLSVYARFTRRGGIDINPFRSNFEEPLENVRLWRQ